MPVGTASPHSRGTRPSGRERRLPARVVLNEGPPPGHVAATLRRTARLLLRAANRIVPKRAGSCVLAAFPDVEDGVLALSAALLDDGRRVTLLTSGPVPPGFLDPRVRVERRASVRGVCAFLRSGHVIVTHGVYDDVVRPGRQTLVYLWHGESPGKMLDSYFGARAKAPGHAPVLSSVGRAFRCAEFGLPPTLVPVLGAPRNDRLLGASRAAARAALGVADDRTRLVWAPTYREGRIGALARRDSAAGYAGLPFGEAELRELDAWLGRRGVTVHVLLHPVQHGAFRLDTRHLVALRREDLLAAGRTTYTALPAFDGLITDVSSIWVDWLLLDRPLVFAFPDVEEYRRRRGFELEPFDEWVPGPFTRTLDGLTAAIGDVADGRDPDAARRAVSRRLLHRHADDGSSRRVVEYLFHCAATHPK